MGLIIKTAVGSAKFLDLMMGKACGSSDDLADVVARACSKLGIPLGAEFTCFTAFTNKAQEAAHPLSNAYGEVLLYLRPDAISADLLFTCAGDFQDHCNRLAGHGATVPAAGDLCHLHSLPADQRLRTLADFVAGSLGTGGQVYSEGRIGRHITKDDLCGWDASASMDLSLLDMGGRLGFPLTSDAC